jgi:hypothetical protein
MNTNFGTIFGRNTNLYAILRSIAKEKKYININFVSNSILKTKKYNKNNMFTSNSFYKNVIELTTISTSLIHVF